MKNNFGTWAAVCLVFAGLGVAGSTTVMAQAPDTTTPPNVLVIQQEMLKPGMSGLAHEKTESAFVEAMKNAKSPDNYFAAESMSGPSRALFFLPFDSFAAWQKASDAIMTDTTLGSEFDSASQADGKLLKSYATAVFVYKPEMSTSPNVDLAQMRYMAITVIHIKPGHGAEWNQLDKMHNEVYGQLPNVHNAMWEEDFGDEGGEYIVTTPLKSLAEIDEHRIAAKKAWAAVSADKKQKMGDLEASCFASVHTNLYSFNPKMSYVPDRWKTASPDFWGKQ